MPSQRSHPRGFQAGRSGAHDNDLFGFLARGECVPSQGPLIPGGRRLQAADSPAEGDPADAALVAGDALADVLLPALAGLVGQFRIGDQGPDHVDHIPLSVLQDFFGQAGIIDAVGGVDRKFHYRPDPGRQGQGIGQRGVHGPFD